MTSIWRLIYTSRRTCAQTAAAHNELQCIQAEATANNRRTGLSGALIASPSRFAQVLEGPREALEITFERISRDSRHDDLLVMSFAPTEKPAFHDFRLVMMTMDDPGASDAETAGEAMVAHLRESMGRLDIAQAARAL
jgi:hypothetical protein